MTDQPATRPASFDAAVVQWLPFLKKMAFRMERKAQDREDLINETVATALHRWASYRPEGSFPGWLVFQMRERCTAMRGKNARSVEVAGGTLAQLDEGYNPAGRANSRSTKAAPNQESAVELAQVFDAMPRRYHSVMAKLAAGYEQREIAAEEGVSRQAIHQRVLACRARLKRVTA